MWIDESKHKDILDKVDDYGNRIKRLAIERRKYMDSVMEEVSPYKIGDEYVNVITRERVKVVEIYRRSSVGHGDIFKDNSISDIHARFDNGDNTSRYGYYDPYIRASDYDNKTKEYYGKIENYMRFG